MASSSTPTTTTTSNPPPTPPPTPASTTNNLQIVVSGVSSHDEPSVDQGGQSSESASAVAVRPVAQPQADVAANYQLILAEQDREYGCRYCTKKFSNKQALGGHQNAHKVERLMEKDVQDRSNVSYFGPTHHGRMNMAAAAAAPYVPYYRSRGYDFMHRSIYGCGGVIPYHSRQAAAAGGGYYGGGWPGHRMHRPYGGRSHYAMQPIPQPQPQPQPLQPQNYMTIRLPNFGPGSSNAAYYNYHQGRVGFPGMGGVLPAGAPNNGPGPAAVVNLRNVPAPPAAAGDGGEAEVDLSLKL